MPEDKTTHTGEGIPVGASPEEKRLRELGVTAKSGLEDARRRSDDAAEESRAQDKVLQRTQKGYVETSVDDIPLSDKVGEGRRRQGDDDE